MRLAGERRAAGCDELVHALATAMRHRVDRHRAVAAELELRGERCPRAALLVGGVRDGLHRVALGGGLHVADKVEAVGCERLGGTHRREPRVACESRRRKAAERQRARVREGSRGARRREEARGERREEEGEARPEAIERAQSRYLRRRAVCRTRAWTGGECTPWSRPRARRTPSAGPPPCPRSSPC